MQNRLGVHSSNVGELCHATANDPAVKEIVPGPIGNVTALGYEDEEDNENPNEGCLVVRIDVVENNSILWWIILSRVLDLFFVR